MNYTIDLTPDQEVAVLDWWTGTPSSREVMSRTTADLLEAVEHAIVTAIQARQYTVGDKVYRTVESAHRPWTVEAVVGGEWLILTSDVMTNQPPDVVNISSQTVAKVAS